jgi:hypothetical protein
MKKTIFTTITIVTLTLIASTWAPKKTQAYTEAVGPAPQATSSSSTFEYDGIKKSDGVIYD